MPTLRRVVVTDVQERASLAAARCLAACGYEVTAVASTILGPGLWSLAPRRRRLAPPPRETVEGFIAHLEATLRRTEHDLLMAGTDDSLLAVSLNRARLARHVDLGLPEHPAVQDALDKRRLIDEAARVGLDAPESRVCAGPAGAAEAAQELGYPVLVKPLRTVIAEGGRTRRWFSSLVTDPASLATVADSIGSCIVQRREAGPVISFAAVATDRGLVSPVVSRYFRTSPPTAGNVAFSETIAYPASLRERVQALTDGLGWRGLFELELIERPDGGYAAIDFNPRAYGSLSLAVAAGAPLPALWCRWAMGETPSDSPVRLGVRYRWEDADFRNFLWQLKHRRLEAGRAVARPRRHVVHAYFQARDPAPLLARGVQLLGERLTRAR